jgi:hypothetical protein
MLSPKQDQANREGNVQPKSFVRKQGCESGHWIQSVSDDGEIVSLEDGSVWQVNEIDAIDSMLWLPTEDVVACSDHLIDTDNGEKVSARRLK